MSKLFRQASRINKTGFKFSLQLTIEGLRLHPQHHETLVVISLNKRNKTVATPRARLPSVRSGRIAIVRDMDWNFFCGDIEGKHHKSSTPLYASIFPQSYAQQDDWGDLLNLVATLYRDKHGRYQEKMYTISVRQVSGK